MGIIEDAHNVRVVGSGLQAVVLAMVWSHQGVVLFDNMGDMGAGTTNPDYFDFERYSTLDGYAYDLIAILEELRVESCIFVGHSLHTMVGCLASIIRPDLFSKIVMVSTIPRFLNLEGYCGGLAEDLSQLFEAIKSNYKSWVDGFGPLTVGENKESVAVQEFSRTLFNMRPDIALSVAQTIFQSDMRPLLSHVKVPCHIIQSNRDMAVPVVVSEYLHRNLGGESMVEIMPTDGHLPQLSSPDIFIPILLRHIRYEIALLTSVNTSETDHPQSHNACHYSTLLLLLLLFSSVFSVGPVARRW
ncbi:hypothetical protein AAC387_Pa01g4307 [Persea americana]